MQPTTPPRTRRFNNSSQTKGLYTPKTPFGKTMDKALQSSETLNKRASASSIISPGLTPRHRSSKKLGDAFMISSSTTTSRSLFPPTPSTIGSGRSKTNNLLLPQAQLSPVDQNRVQLDESPIPVPTKRKLIFEESEEEEDLEDLEQYDSDVLKTPSKKLISDDLIKEWNREQYKTDNDGEVSIKQGSLVNPFMTSSSTSDKFNLKRNHNPGELILINKKGEKITKQLDSNYKPKNLFNDLQKASSSKDFLVYNDTNEKNLNS
jgi:hypothetical protein